MTLRAGEPESVVTATVVRVSAAGLGTGRDEGAGHERAAAGRRWPAGGAARGVACGASRRSSSTVGAGRRAGSGARSRRSDGPGDPGGGTVPGRGGGVPAAALDAQPQRGGALLADPDRRRSARPRRGRPRARSRRPRRGRTTGRTPRRTSSATALRAALPETSSSQPNESHTSCAGTCPASSSVSTASQIPTSEPLSSSVPRPQIAPSTSVGAERRVLPGRALVDRHDVEVRHQHDRARRRCGPASGTSRACSLDPGQLEPRVQQRELRARARRGTRRRPRCRRARGRGARRSGSAPVPGAWRRRAAAPRRLGRLGRLGHGAQPSGVTGRAR